MRPQSFLIGHPPQLFSSAGSNTMPHSEHLTVSPRSALLAFRILILSRDLSRNNLSAMDLIYAFT
jgi:hypothetical protein